LHDLADDDGARGVGQLLELAKMFVDGAPRAGALQWRADEYRAIDRRSDGYKLFRDEGLRLVEGSM
jgi:hypothetical protein